ncbi:MAG: hypothetical protein ND807_12915 [Vicinamibacterales bacterium]|nr:hypothetical protein [Vicinamibacterales bacterium]
MPDRTELNRLVLQIARDLCAQDNLRTLLVAADASLVDHRRELRTVKARIKRASMKPPK